MSYRKEMILFGYNGADKWVTSQGARDKDCLGHVHIKDCKVDIARATVRFCPLGEGHMAPYLGDIAAALKRDKYQGVVSLESVFRPDNGTFEDGFRKSLSTFTRLFGP